MRPLVHVDFENPLDLCGQAVQQPKVAASGADDDRNCFSQPTASAGSGTSKSWLGGEPSAFSVGPGLLATRP